MRVTIEVGHHVSREALHQALAVKGGASMIEVDSIFVLLARIIFIVGNLLPCSMGYSVWRIRSMYAS